MRSLSFSDLGRAALITTIFGAGALSACAPEINQDAVPPSRISPVFDPVTSTIPLPNNAAMDASDGTLRDLPTINEDSAEGEFAKWLTQLHGWLPETGIEIPIGGKLDEASLNAGNVKLFSISRAADGATSLTELESTVAYRETETGSVISIVPTTKLSPNQEYAALALTEIKDDAGNTILAPAAIYTAMNKGNIIDPNTNAILLPELNDADDPAGSLATATSLQGLHNTLLPIINAIEEGKISNSAGETITRKDVAVAFTWRTAADPFTVLDPATATIPLPNSLALDADGTFPTAALPALAEYNRALKAFQDGETTEAPKMNAQVWFDRYLDSLHGWPYEADDVPLELPVTGDLDESTLTEDSVQLWKRTAEGAEQVTGLSFTFIKGDNGVNKIKITPPADLEHGADYFAFATTDIKATNGLGLLPPAPIYMALQPHPVIDAMGKSLVSRLSDGNAQSIAGVKQLLGPVMDIIKEKTGKEHGEIASAWSWFSWKDPFIVFDPTTGDVPIPNAFLINSTTGKVNLPTAGASGLQLALLNELNTRDGFSVLGSAWFTVVGELDPASVTLFEGGNEGAVALAGVAGLPSIITGDKIELDYRKDMGKLFIRPKVPLTKNLLHAGIISDRLKGVNGLAAKPTPAFVFLASSYPLVEDGKSLVSQLDDATAQSLESARLSYDRLFTGARVATGDTRDTITCAFAFTTDDHTEPLQQARARTMSKLGDAPLAAARAAQGESNVTNPNDGSWATYSGPYSGGATHNFDNIAEIQWTAEFDSMAIYGAQANELTYDEMVALRVPISVFVPKTVQGSCEAPFNTAIVLHGVGGTRQGAAYVLANELAKPSSCLATVVMDMPTHGGRAAGVGSLHPDMRPSNSGDGFLSPNLLATRANFAQGGIDVSVLARIIADGGLSGVVNAGDVFSDKIGLAGISLGSAVGTLGKAISPEITTLALNVPPGKLTYYLTEPSNIGEGIVMGLGALGIMPGTFTYEQTVAFVQWMADVVDPTGFAPYITQNTLQILEYVPGGIGGDATKLYRVKQDNGMDLSAPTSQVLIQLAQGDQTTPNVATEGLAATMGVSLDKTTFMGPHGFIGGDDANARCGKQQVAAWLSSGLNDGAAVLPANLEATTCVAAGGN